MAGRYLKIADRQMSGFIGLLDDMIRGGADLKQLHRREALKLAYRLGAVVRARYRSQDVGTKGMSRKVQTEGKDQGHVNPAKRPLAPKERGLELLAQAVEVRKHAGGAAYLVCINPTAQHPTRGVPLTTIAQWVERPSVVVIRRTLRSMVYMKLLREGKAGYGRKATKRTIPVDKVIAAPVIWRPKGRSVWLYVMRELNKDPRLLPAMAKEIVNSIGRVALRRGATLRKR